MSRLRVLLLAPDANPESISLALEGFSHGEALAQLHSVTMVARACNEAPLRRAQSHFAGIVGVRMPLLDQFYEWSLHSLFRDNLHSRALTPFLYPFSIAFEWFAWRRTRDQINAGDFDVVMRLLPANPVLPSAFPFLLRKCSVPFVIGPMNGGLPWPPGFSQSESQRSWIDNLRNLYRFLPFSRSTFRRATAIIAGSSQTYSEFAAHHDKLFFIAENGVNRSLCRDTPRQSKAGGKLDFIFLGALVPYKACDLALRSAASSLRNGLAHLSVVGDGPDRVRLEQLADTLGIKEHVSFCGMLQHGEAMELLSSADVMVYPSVREYGGAVVVEALAAGVVPLVADFGGPGDTVRPDVGFKVRLTNESEVVSELERFLVELTHNRDLLERLRERGMAFVRENMTWDAKALRTTMVLNWAAGRGPKPDFPPPRVLDAKAASTSKEPYRPQEA